MDNRDFGDAPAPGRMPLYVPNGGRKGDVVTRLDDEGYFYDWRPGNVAPPPDPILSITSLAPTQLVIGPTAPDALVHAFGTEFTGTCKLYADGALIASSAYVSPTEMTFVAVPSAEAAARTIVITVRDGATTGVGAEPFQFVTEITEVLYGRGLSLDESLTPPVVNLQPAGHEPKLLGGVYTLGQRTATEGLDLDPAAGRLTVPLATDLLAGAIVEPLPDDLQYARMRTAAGVSSWVPVTSLYQGRWQPGANLPDIGALAKKDQWTWVADCAVADAPEQAPAGMPGIGGLPVYEGDWIVWDEATAAFLRISAPGIVQAGVGLSKTGRRVDLLPPNLADPADRTNIGGVRAFPRSLTQGLQLDGDGLLAAPLASDLLAGSIVEPPLPGIAYARFRDAATGTNQWRTIIVTGDTAPADPTPSMLWWNTKTGQLALWYVDADSSQWVQVNSGGGGGGSSSTLDEAPKDGTPYARQDATWVPATVLAQVATSGDVKSGFQAADHAGWIRLDGRSISALTATQNAAAVALGFTTNLPDASGAVPLQNGGALGAVSGSMSRTLDALSAVDFVVSDGTAAHTLARGATLDITPAAMSVNQFIFLGA